MSSRIHRFVAVVLILCAPGCATVNFDYPKKVSVALQNTDETSLGRQLKTLVSAHPDGEAGFRPISDGIEALAIRLLMAERAQMSIDAQYYLLKNDTTGNAFLSALLRAADRGVRVRLLLDDMFTSGYDAGMAGLDSHPNFEVRIFNPFASRTARLWDGVTSFSRINRRMHNKSFTADNQVTLIGGRNIADEYFGAREDAKFLDLDVLGIGAIVHDVSEMFDTYWNHERAAPVAAFAKMPDDPAAELGRLRNELKLADQRITDTRYAAAVRAEILLYVEADSNEVIWAPYSLVVDSPDKNFKARADEVDSITTPLRESLLSAETEMVVLSPYFVPRKSGVEAFSELVSRGIEVTIVTNSLAANNQAVVHSGYAPARKPLLQNGVKIYETREDANVSGSQIVAVSGAKATMHTKAFVIDRKEVFIGSFNFDPRSININTELGVIIHSPQIAELLLASLESNLANKTYQVFLNENGKVRWRSNRNGETIVFDKEPGTTWVQRFSVGFMRILPIRGQL